MTDAPEPTAVRPSGARAAEAPALPVARTSATTDVALVATFAAFIAVCAILPAIPVAGLAVPITLQTFGVMLTGIVLGARRGALAVLLYVVVGLAGLPVFSGGAGGLAVVAKPSFGYIVGFVLAAALVGFLVSRFAARLRPARRYWAVFACATVTSLVAIHPLGIAVMGWRLDMSPGEAIAAGATFLPGDVVKNLVAALVATALFRAFPDLLRSRR
ncbi:biotin transporter BioY [Cellulomonas cellasea]|uniref:Biotin transporter n=1 Tax=Cellulomonas cellasea TaxID=43670 RepID=A0A7W4UDI3_9CELL|nr:biotin transporter BioY [Cellulomonas cellasea]MBB2922169.1 biotin transport system substrate-specific component [Cellulomonas cellasea]